MKKKDFEKHLRSYGCKLKRQGGKHEIWENSLSSSWSTIPRHRELKKYLCDKICNDLDIPLL